MTDTPEEIKQLVREQIMARPPAERFVMGAEMFDSALGVVKASLPANLSSSEYKRQLFKRLYGLELLAWLAESGVNRRH
jgi:hypothetical protein